jgi:hypothetical protein
MSKTVRGHRPSPVIVLVLTLLMAGLAATGHAATMSGPAIVGSVTLSQNGANIDAFFAGQCKGTSVGFTLSLSNLTVSDYSTATSLEGLSLPAVGPAGCLSPSGGEDLTVNTVVRPQFMNTGSVLVATVVLLFVLP